MLHLQFLPPYFHGSNKSLARNCHPDITPEARTLIPEACEPRWLYPRVNVYSLILKIAIEIVDLAVKNGDFPYQGVSHCINLHRGFGWWKTPKLGCDLPTEREDQKNRAVAILMSGMACLTCIFGTMA